MLRYTHMLNGYSSLNLTKLDVLDELDHVRIAVGYKINGQLLPAGQMPSTLEELRAVEVVYESTYTLLVCRAVVISTPSRP